MYFMRAIKKMSIKNISYSKKKNTIHTFFEDILSINIFY